MPSSSIPAPNELAEQMTRRIWDMFGCINGEQGRANLYVYLKTELTTALAENQKLQIELETSKATIISREYTIAYRDNKIADLEVENQRKEERIKELERAGADIALETMERCAKKEAELSSQNASLRSALEKWTPFYESELEDCDKEIRKCKDEGDSHGRNFFEGMQSGFIKTDIWLTEIKRLSKALALPVVGEPMVRRSILSELYDEYQDRKSQWGSEYLWSKHETPCVIEAAEEELNRTKPSADGGEVKL